MSVDAVPVEVTLGDGAGGPGLRDDGRVEASIGRAVAN